MENLARQIVHENSLPKKNGAAYNIPCELQMLGTLKTLYFKIIIFVNKIFEKQ